MPSKRRSPRSLRFPIACSLALALGIAAPAVSAQTGADAAVRRELVEQAQRARAANDHTRALDLATRASSLQMSPSLRMFIAEEQAALGQFADALNNAELCGREAERDTGSRTHEAVMNACRQLAVTVRPRVARVTVQIPPPSPAGVHVTLAGHELNSALFGVPYIVNPGVVVVEATAEGMRPVRREVTVAAGASLDVPLAFERVPSQVVAQPTNTVALVPVTPPTQVVASAAPPVAVSTAPAASPSPTQTTASVAPVPPTHSDAPAATGPGAGPWVLVGSGVVVAALSGVFYALRERSILDLERTCGGPMGLLCPVDSQHFLGEAQRWTTLSGIALGVGGAAVASGLLWFALAPRSHRDRARLDIAPTSGGAMVGFSGRF